MRAVGVASPRAQGQAMTNVAMAAERARENPEAPGSTQGKKGATALQRFSKNSGAQKSTAKDPTARDTTTGTNTDVTRSAKA
ncbi:MAG: hypothetical protein BWY88_01125 [Synergistetes bacterium ADurb.Bin520]|nr:MAG: hypothetical protein BWY88_01125 [Synergistetes bacterium ADurb.Bin520]